MCDDYSPAIDGLLQYLLLEQLNLLCPNPTPEQVKKMQPIIDTKLPIEQGRIGGEWYWKASSPCYVIRGEQTDRIRKRWDYQESNLDWGKRKPKWNTSEGAEKSYDLPLYLRSVSVITWYVVGNLDGIKSLLNDCTAIGKKPSIGYGQISRWEVEEVSEDWHMWQDGKLMRPIPIECVPQDRPIDIAFLNWGWRPPTWLHSNKVKCAMPMHTVRR
ncbi:MAG: hypothetical protein ACRC8K_15480 [Waterburya sp.]